MAGVDEITRLIPHRPPFLFVDSIVSCTDTTIVTHKRFDKTLDFYAGHYPNNPITPGVILSEAIFQSGALLIAKNSDAHEMEGVPVLTRIVGAKYKRSVFPNDCAEIKITLKERLAAAWFMKGVLRVDGKIAVQIEFACTMTARTEG